MCISPVAAAKPPYQQFPDAYRQQTHRPDAKLPEDDLIFFLLDLVPQLDLTPSPPCTSRNSAAFPLFVHEHGNRFGNGGLEPQ
jgi:hypothetical protein